jgi:hypothetical protein
VTQAVSRRSAYAKVLVQCQASSSGAFFGQSDTDRRRCRRVMEVFLSLEHEISRGPVEAHILSCIKLKLNIRTAVVTACTSWFKV